MQNGNCDSNTNNIYTKFREKIFNASQEIELQKMAINRTKYTNCACDNLRNIIKITGFFLKRTQAQKQKGRQTDKELN